METVFEAHHSHFYAGHEGVLSGDTSLSSKAAHRTCRVEFADGAIAPATLVPSDGGRWSLMVGPYRTAAGSEIPAKNWIAAFTRGEDGQVRFRILGKAPASTSPFGKRDA